MRVVGEHMISMSVVEEHMVPVSVVEGHMVHVVCLRLLLHANQMHLMIQTHRSVEMQYTPSTGLTFPPVDVTFLQIDAISLQGFYNEHLPHLFICD